MADIQLAKQVDLENKVDKVAGKQLSTEDYSTAEKTKVEGIEIGAQVNTVTSVNGSVGDVTGLATASELTTLETTVSEHQANETTNAHVISNVTGLQTALDNKVTKNPTLNWVTPTLLNGWNGTTPTGYVKDDFGFVHLKGLISGGTKTTGTTLYTFDVGYRPSGILYLHTSSTSSSASVAQSLFLDSTGNLKIHDFNSLDYIFLDGITFKAEQ